MCFKTFDLKLLIKYKSLLKIVFLIQCVNIDGMQRLVIAAFKDIKMELLL